MLLDLEHAALAVVRHMSTAGLMDAGGGRRSFFWAHFSIYVFSSHPVVKDFSSAKHFNAINLYKSFLHSLSPSLSLSFCISLWPSPSVSVSLLGLARAPLLSHPSLSLALSGMLNGGQARIAAACGSCIIFMSLAGVQGLIFIPVLILCIRGCWSVNLIYLASVLTVHGKFLTMVHLNNNVWAVVRMLTHVHQQKNHLVNLCL